MHFVVRYAGSAAAAAAAMRAAVAKADPLVPITIAPLAARAADSLSDRRLLVLIAGGFGSIALLLSAAGIHAMMTFVVARQRRDAAIRLALGAAPGTVLRLVAAQGLVPAAVGIAIGTGLAVPLGRVMRAQLFQIAPYDARAIGTAVAVALAAAAIASLLPARRAARVDAAVALRQE
jgi:ABC-type antimicrobial peptide transport system permease subunit